MKCWFKFTLETTGCNECPRVTPLFHLHNFPTFYFTQLPGTRQRCLDSSQAWFYLFDWQPHARNLKFDIFTWLHFRKFSQKNVVLDEHKSGRLSSQSALHNTNGSCDHTQSPLHYNHSLAHFLNIFLLVKSGNKKKKIFILLFYHLNES